jgi:excisionase family DNA binding protein
MVATEERLMTLQQVADYLQLSAKTIRRMFQLKELPAIKLGKEWRARKFEIDKALAKRGNR